MIRYIILANQQIVEVDLADESKGYVYIPYRLYVTREEAEEARRAE